MKQKIQKWMALLATIVLAAPISAHAATSVGGECWCSVTFPF